MSPVLPALDWYIGRMAQSLKQNDDGTWEIVLEGDILIKSYDPNLEVPTTLYTMEDANYDESQDEAPSDPMYFQGQIIDARSTIMLFGRKDDPEQVRVILTTPEYSVRDDRFQGGKEVFPARGPEAEVNLVPPGALRDALDSPDTLRLDHELPPADPSPERAQEAPLSTADGLTESGVVDDLPGAETA